MNTRRLNASGLKKLIECLEKVSPGISKVLAIKEVNGSANLKIKDLEMDFIVETQFGITSPVPPAQDDKQLPPDAAQEERDQQKIIGRAGRDKMVNPQEIAKVAQVLDKRYAQQGQVVDTAKQAVTANTALMQKAFEKLAGDLGNPQQLLHK